MEKLKYEDLDKYVAEKRRRAEAGEMASQLAKWILANFSGRLHDTRLVCEKAQSVISKLEGN